MQDQFERGKEKNVNVVCRLIVLSLASNLRESKRYSRKVDD